jgi:hypothetical protein
MLPTGEQAGRDQWDKFLNSSESVLRKHIFLPGPDFPIRSGSGSGSDSDWDFFLVCEELKSSAIFLKKKNKLIRILTKEHFPNDSAIHKRQNIRI